MITIEKNGNLISMAALGEFTLADYQEFEALVNTPSANKEPINLLLDLQEMAGFTVDVVLEDIRFARQHEHDFRRIAVVTHSPLISWMAWLEKAFVDADIDVFSDPEDARTWLSAD